MYFKIIHSINKLTGRSQYHAQFHGRNHEIVWWTENYTTEDGALYAIALIKSGGPAAPLK
jgi:uncharacterized protein YegP (UPF0339 family)